MCFSITDEVIIDATRLVGHDGWREKQESWKASMAKRLNVKRSARCRSAWQKWQTRQEPEIGTARNHRRVKRFRFVKAYQRTIVSEVVNEGADVHDLLCKGLYRVRESSIVTSSISMPQSAP